jgi:metal-sulfur cluster biosynthetic enzyme
MDLSQTPADADPADLTARLGTVVDPEIGINVVVPGLICGCDVHTGVVHILMAASAA